MMNMATYPEMGLGGEVRESICLDEDDQSEVEDEVFIRNGKTSYKLADELNVKRPLMAPRFKSDKPTRLRPKSHFRSSYKPSCLIVAAVIMLIGLIVLIVILVSLFPLPLDKIRKWVAFTSESSKNTTRILPCSSLKVYDLWSINLPLLTTASPARAVDLNRDGIEDVIFGFGTSETQTSLPSDTFCSLFLGVSPPCEGGIIALNGISGTILWKIWVNDTIFAIQCVADFNGDGMVDCLATGIKGSLIAINSVNGSLIWQQNNYKMDVFVATIVPDQNSDNVSDILSSYTSLKAGKGQLLLLSGKNGQNIKSINTPNQTRTFFMPQLFESNFSKYVIFGTGDAHSPGNLSIVSLNDILNGNMYSRTIYEDKFKGILMECILVDITGDGIADIVTAMYNSTVVAVDGASLIQIWNYTIPNCEFNIIPTPGYFNSDNVTDFLIIYQMYDNILNYNFTKAFIIDGKKGTPINVKPITGSILDQMGGLTLRMEGYGLDLFLFWTSDCKININKRAEFDQIELYPTSKICRKRSNTSIVTKLNALNQYDQPPGFEVYSFVSTVTPELDNTKTDKRDKYIRPKGNFEDELAVKTTKKDKVNKYGSSNFRHRSNSPEKIQENMKNEQGQFNSGMIRPLYNDYDASQHRIILNTYAAEMEPDYPIADVNILDPTLYEQKLNGFDQSLHNNARDPRSKLEVPQLLTRTTNPKQTYNAYDYENIKNARSRLLSDLSSSPKEILREVFLETREKGTKLEQRDIRYSHLDTKNEDGEVNVIKTAKGQTMNNLTYNLWDLESEKEEQDLRMNQEWRSKRETDFVFRKVSSLGALVSAFNASLSFIDMVFLTFWQLPVQRGQQILEEKLRNCLNKIFDDSETYGKETPAEQTVFHTKQCTTEQEKLRREFSYFNDIHQLRIGQITVNKIRIECQCAVEKAGEMCAKFLPQDAQAWSMYLGKMGDGVFKIKV